MGTPTEWPNFTGEELGCSHCGEANESQHFKTFMGRVQALRTWYGKPMRVTSAYRCPLHPIEAKKENGAGEHSRGSIDFQIPVEDRHSVVAKAFEMDFRGIGWNLKGERSQRFIHLDDRVGPPRIWSY
jgi:zinc D-Ala-D-Ala carboxypeptidase